MSWTTPAGLRAQVQKLWERGALLVGLAGGPPLFPRRLVLKGPTSSELTERFSEVRVWIARLDGEAKHYRVVRRTVNHRVLGTNAVPAEIWIDTLEEALALIGRRRDAERFAELVALTAARLPPLIAWLARRPLRALELADDWPRLLEIVAWRQRHPRPGVYLRQVDIPGVHSKFIEGYQRDLGELFDLVLPQETSDASASRESGFCRRYGFCDKPLRVRFRILDENFALFPTGTDQDLAVTVETFSRLDLPVRRVFITENEINFLTFPSVPGSLVIFGAGYGFEMLSTAGWLHGCEIHYWGDIDTHGFAILDQLRNLFPFANSFLMDRETLLAHRLQWGFEPHPEGRELTHLTGEEHALYDDLRQHRLGDSLRLEQERVGFHWVAGVLDRFRKG